MGSERLRRPLVAPLTEQSTRKIITSTQYLASFTTPVTLVPAPKTGFALVFNGAVIHKPAGTAYNAANNITIKYTNASGLEVSQVAVVGFMDQTTVQTRFMKPHAAASGANSTAVVAASPLVLHTLVADPTTGTGGLRIRVWYFIVPMVP